MLKDLLDQSRYDEAIQYIHNIGDRAVKLYKLSLIYRLQNMHEHEKKIINIALAHNIKPDYFNKRKDWHNLPLLHRDPYKCKLFPRRPISLYRNKPIDLDFCFVSASGSDAPYFQLSVELLESIKATSYRNVPFKMIDCGLNDDDKNYLIKRFGVEIKDPGFDVSPALVQGGRSWSREINFNGWKGLTARPYLHKHFPGYSYYFWIDTDTWVQNESCIDAFLILAKKQGIVAPIDPGNNPSGEVNAFIERDPYILPKFYTNEINKHPSLFDGIFCSSVEFLEAYARESKRIVDTTKKYVYAQDYLVLTYMFYTNIENYVHLKPGHFFSVDQDFPNQLLTHDNKIYDQYRNLLGFLSFNIQDKSKIFWDVRHKDNPEKHSLESLRYRSWPNDKENIKHLLVGA